MLDDNLDDEIVHDDEEKMDDVQEVTCSHVQELRLSGEDFTLIDVREPDEYEHCHIKGSLLIPLHTLETKLNELDKEEIYVIYCKSGRRSHTAAEIMIENGFEDVSNMIGGINQWSLEVDNNMPLY